jgi:uncharacterized protein YbaR (Trm112 family)
MLLIPSALVTCPACYTPDLGVREKKANGRGGDVAPPEYLGMWGSRRDVLYCNSCNYENETRPGLLSLWQLRGVLRLMGW